MYTDIQKSINESIWAAVLYKMLAYLRTYLTLLDAPRRDPAHESTNLLLGELSTIPLASYQLRKTGTALYLRGRHHLLTRITRIK